MLDTVVKDDNYGSRGNVILHAGEAQVFAAPGNISAHAIRSRTSGSYQYAYQYEGSGNLLSTTRALGGNSINTHAKFDRRGRLAYAWISRNVLA